MHQSFMQYALRSSACGRKGSGRGVHLLFCRSFLRYSMYVRWYVFVVSFGTFDFGGSGAREEQNGALAHVRW